jgi:hypothetical protein
MGKGQQLIFNRRPSVVKYVALNYPMNVVPSVAL